MVRRKVVIPNKRCSGQSRYFVRCPFLDRLNKGGNGCHLRNYIFIWLADLAWMLEQSWIKSFILLEGVGSTGKLWVSRNRFLWGVDFQSGNFWREFKVSLLSRGDFLVVVDGIRVLDESEETMVGFTCSLRWESNKPVVFKCEVFKLPLWDIRECRPPFWLDLGWFFIRYIVVLETPQNMVELDIKRKM